MLRIPLQTYLSSQLNKANTNDTFIKHAWFILQSTMSYCSNKANTYGTSKYTCTLAPQPYKGNT